MEKKRTCLRCGKLFMSKSVGNRICSPCHGRKGMKTDIVHTRKKITKQLRKRKIKPDTWHGRLFSEERDPDDR